MMVESRKHDERRCSDGRFAIHLSSSSIVLTLAVAIAGPFLAGSLAGWMLQLKHISAIPVTTVTKPALPVPTLPRGKTMPDATYSAKHFNMPGATSRKNDIMLDTMKRTQDETKKPESTKTGPNSHQWELVDHGNNNSEVYRKDDDDDDEDDEEVAIHQPKGQHLLVDIKNVDGVFLDSEGRLANAMVTLISQSELTLLSYHCHGLEPMGVTCVGVLLESHVSFHTWPVPGVITLDLFTCGSKSLIPLLSLIEELFAHPQEKNSKYSEAVGGSISPPHMMWVHKRRGFDFSDIYNAEEMEHENYLLGWRDFDLKNRVAHEDTPFQEFEVYDVIDSRSNSLETYQKSLVQDKGETYESQHPELFRPERIVYLDHVMQSRRSGLEPYHEALVHPAMMTHASPRRVAIIGGGEGATLREVLKHNTVETCVMVEIDSVMVNASRAYLPEWSDCSNLVGSPESCFDNPRAEVYFEDAVAWFLSRFSDADKIDDKDRFDVIIMDALDPSSLVEFSDSLYGSIDFTTALYNALTDQGILVAQVGAEDTLLDPGWAYDPQGKEMSKMMRLWEQVGFTSARDYSEMHGGFRAPWGFIIAFRQDDPSKVQWYANQAQVDLELSARAMPTTRSGNGESLFEYFDGATMMGYQAPSLAVQEVFCRGEDPAHRDYYCKEAHSRLDPYRLNIPLSKLKNGAALPKSDISGKKHPYLAAESAVHDVLIMPTTVEWMTKMKQKEWQSAISEFGYRDEYFSKKAPAYIVDTAQVNQYISPKMDDSNYCPNHFVADKNMTLDGLDDAEQERAQVPPFYAPPTDRNHLLYRLTAGINTKDHGPSGLRAALPKTKTIM